LALFKLFWHCLVILALTQLGKHQLPRKVCYCC